MYGLIFIFLIVLIFGGPLLICGLILFFLKQRFGRKIIDYIGIPFEKTYRNIKTAQEIKQWRKVHKKNLEEVQQRRKEKRIALENKEKEKRQQFEEMLGADYEQLFNVKLFFFRLYNPKSYVIEESSDGEIDWYSLTGQGIFHISEDELNDAQQESIVHYVDMKLDNIEKLTNMYKRTKLWSESYYGLTHSFNCPLYCYSKAALYEQHGRRDDRFNKVMIKYSHIMTKYGSPKEYDYLLSRNHTLNIDKINDKYDEICDSLKRLSYSEEDLLTYRHMVVECAGYEKINEGVSLKLNFPFNQELYLLGDRNMYYFESEPMSFITEEEAAGLVGRFIAIECKYLDNEYKINWIRRLVLNRKGFVNNLGLSEEECHVSINDEPGSAIDYDAEYGDRASELEEMRMKIPTNDPCNMNEHFYSFCDKVDTHYMAYKSNIHYMAGDEAFYYEQHK